MEGSDDDEKFDTDDVDHAKGVAKEVNLMKLKSEGLLEEARLREGEVYGGGEGSDKYMPMNQVKDTMNNLEKRYSVDIEKASPGEEKDKLMKLQSKDRYKAMKELDRQNERASPKQIARRLS